MHEKVKKQFFIIDGYSYLFRAYHSMPPLTNQEGTPVGAVYGFTNMLTKLQNRIHSSKAEEVFMLIAFDAGRKTFRNDIYPEYKANRPPPPEDLIPQFPLVRDAAEALNIKTLQVEGFEADDIIATYTKQAESEGMNVIIVSSDKDLMQLINIKTKMYDPMRDKIIGKEEVFEKFGVYPDKILDLLSLMGDSIDNIPGVPGIGPKTASELLNKYGTLEGILKNTDKIKQNKRRETLIENKETALLSRELAKLNFEVTLNDKFEDLKIQRPKTEKLFSFLNKHGFKSLIKNLEKNNAEELEKIKTNQPKSIKEGSFSLINNFQIIENKTDLEKILDNINKIKNIALYPYEENGKLELISLNINGDSTAIITPKKQGLSKDSPSHQEDLFSTKIGNQEENKETINNFDYFFNYIEKLIKIRSINFIYYNFKGILNKKYSHPPNSYIDIHSLYYCIKGITKTPSLSTTAELELKIDLPDEKKLTTLEEQEKLKYIANYSAILAELYNELKPELFNSKLNYPFYEIDNKLIPVLSKIESEGIKIDENILNKLSNIFENKILDLEKEIHQIANEDFNIASPKQLGEVLFNHMGIEGGKKTKTGQYKTDSDKLEELAASGHDIADKILNWRSLSKLTNTYTKALVKEINPVTKRVHTNFHITTTTTGRLSSTNPNLQNIPIRTENGRKIREAFIADEGKILVGADYSQIELRLLAHMANIEVLKNAFKNGEDIHSATAAKVFGVDINSVDAEMRRKAKTVNFGIIYGQSAFGLAKQLRISRSEAKEMIEEYFKQYPGIKAYMNDTIEYAKEHEFVKTLHGRRIYLKAINDKNGMTRSFAERAAINAPLQGTAADIIKLAMIRIDQELKKQASTAKILLQIHDELIIECDKGEEKITTNLIKDIMENVIKLSVPLTVDTNIGKDWGEIH